MPVKVDPAKMITTSEAARLHGVTSRYIGLLCQNGAIKGAVRFGKAWMVPREAKWEVKPRGPKPAFGLSKRERQKRMEQFEALAPGDLLTVRRVAHYLGVSERTVWRWRVEGVIPEPAAIGDGPVLYWRVGPLRRSPKIVAMRLSV